MCAERRNRTRLSEGDTAVPSLLLLALGVLLCARLLLIFRLSIHWDEFFFLSQVFDLKSGRLGDSLQTFHTRLLLPLTWLPFQEPDVIVAGRLIMFLCWVAGGGMLFQLLRAGRGTGAALFALLLWGGLPETVLHAGSFRADSLCFLLVLSALFFGTGGAIRFAASTCAAALALAVSLKSGILLLIFVPLVLRRGDSSNREVFRRAILWMFVTALLFAVFILLHRSSLSAHDARGLLGSGTPLPHQLVRLAREFLIPSELPRGLSTFVRSLVESPLIWIVLLTGLVAGSLSWRREKRWDTAPSLLIALAVLLFYRNVFPYFLPFIAFPFCVCAADVFAGSGLMKGRTGFVFVLICLGSAAGTISSWWRFDLAPQRRFLADIHRRFPAPVPYIDRCGMVSSFPKAGPFLSTLVLARYAERGVPVFADILKSEQPVFLIENSPALSLEAEPRFGLLLSEDLKVLRETFSIQDGPWLRLDPKKVNFRVDESIPIGEVRCPECSLFAPY